MNTVQIEAPKRSISAVTDGALELRFLERDEYPLWDALVQTSPQGAIFCRSWWLEAVGNVKIMGCFSAGKLIAGIPLYFERRYQLRICSMPKLTQTWGVVISNLDGKPVTTATREIQILRAFAAKLASFKLFFQAFHPSQINWLPFYWEGFRQTTRFTYVIDEPNPLGRVWDAMHKSTRNEISQATKSGQRFGEGKIEDVDRCQRESYSVRRTAPPHTESYLRRICEAAIRNKAGGCFSVVDQNGQVLSANLLVWDDRRLYLLAGGTKMQFRNTGANSFGIWHAIQMAASRNCKFDFAGSMMESVEHFNRSFGGRAVPYNFIFKAPNALQFCIQAAGKL
ncbi:MAG: family N-acetyltransferase [Acidobacteriales bacterium]|nr:family N-acetyltransferase [Terriglobales bacterium]